MAWDAVLVWLPQTNASFETRPVGAPQDEGCCLMWRPRRFCI